MVIIHHSYKVKEGILHECIALLLIYGLVYGVSFHLQINTLIKQPLYFITDDDNGLPESVQETDMKSSGYVVTPDHKMNMRSSPVLRYSRNGNAMPEEQPPSPISSDVKGFDSK